MRTISVLLFTLFFCSSAFGQVNKEKFLRKIYEYHEKKYSLFLMNGALNGTKKIDTTEYFNAIRYIAHESLKRDTFFLLAGTSIGLGLGGDKGIDRLTLKYKFVYITYYWSCEPSNEIVRAVRIFNDIIEDKLNKNNSKNWELKLSDQISEYEKAEEYKSGFRADVVFVNKDHKTIDSIKANEIKELNILIRNYKWLKCKSVNFKLLIKKDGEVVIKSEYFVYNSDMSDDWKLFVMENFVHGNHLLIDMNCESGNGHLHGSKKIKLY